MTDVYSATCCRGAFTVRSCFASVMGDRAVYVYTGASTSGSSGAPRGCHVAKWLPDTQLGEAPSPSGHHPRATGELNAKGAVEVADNSQGLADPEENSRRIARLEAQVERLFLLIRGAGSLLHEGLVEGDEKLPRVS